MAHKALIDGTAYEIIGGRVLDSGTAYGIAKGRTLIDGTGYDISFWSNIIGNLDVGSSVYMNVDGVSKEFIVVHQGLPSSLYDNSCDGTWLLMKDIYSERVWHSSTISRYKTSKIHNYLNDDFFNLFDSDIQSVIKQVKIPHFNSYGNDPDGSVDSGSNGLDTRVFLLSYCEVRTSTSSGIIDGSILSYFDGVADSVRIAYLDGKATTWWLRTPATNSDRAVRRVSSDGSVSTGGSGCTGTLGVRPALIVPSRTLIDSSFNVLA